MKPSHYIVSTGNKEVAKVAFKTNEIFPIYPITPASEISESVEEWASLGHKNMFGQIPEVIEMQSESGVAGTLHGALQTGSLATTFTASQGLLLMMPNMYKMAGELLPHVIHCPTRSIATHALSVFGDHSDVMAIRQTGYAMLCANSIQEVHDFSFIAQVATHKTQIPFIHFYDGFRTSHEINTLEPISDEVISQLYQPNELTNNLFERRLTPFNPKIKGTSQGPDTFFQGREAINPVYESCASQVQNIMDEFAKYTNRSYKIFEYCGHPEAEHIIVCMGSGAETIEETINHLNLRDEKLGLIKVRLYRPFYKKAFLDALPKSVKNIAVLDRTKEPGSAKEPLFLDVSQTLLDAFQTQNIQHLPRIMGGRYGLSSKEFTPNMVQVIFENLKSETPKTDFTVGINDDLTHKSLKISESFNLNYNYNVEIQLVKKTNETNSFNLERFCQKLQSNSEKFVQGYTEISYKKSDYLEISHLRISENPIKAPYLIQQPKYFYLDSLDILNHQSFLSKLKANTILFINQLETEVSLNQICLDKLKNKGITLYHIPQKDLSELIFEIMKNHNQIKILETSDYLKPIKIENVQLNHQPTDSGSQVHEFIQSILNGEGNELPVSEFPNDGTYYTNTSELNQRFFRAEIPEWDSNACTQCGLCSLACPQCAIRLKSLGTLDIEEMPSSLTYKPFNDKDWQSDTYFSVAINPDQCTGCNHCVDFCETKALKMVKNTPDKKELWDSLSKVPEMDRTSINPFKLKQQQFLEPLYKYPYGPEGCGQAPYLKVLSQLFGDRMLVANATGASSIIGGALPTTPWSTNDEGHGPAWSNSLFEDNAELGLGFALSNRLQNSKVKSELISFSNHIPNHLIEQVLNNPQKTTVDFQKMNMDISRIKVILLKMNSDKALKLSSKLEQLIKKSVWCIGGDGWAYDIGFSGIDHVLASQENINILVLDNEVYDNTGGQASKATPFGASAKFQYQAKPRIKKDLGQIAMTYKHAYVGSIALMANPEQALKTLIEAEQYEGPSIILAYCPSASHGIDMKHPKKHIQAVVNSGHWPLYRYNPELISEGVNPFQLDTETPTLKIQEFIPMEKRFQKLMDSNQPEALFENIQNQYDKKYRELKKLESIF
ncbi:thiamine pyrophosphate-dependent enzyme [Mangrovimonas sp. ST2L15]|uniref:thiamine pyrophosphate-dependent enzyme n=1 Tax=Mangrovimonas sp. ST2L15 TaxID=1645916 RepID=UPI0006B5C4DF|nr:thiamine pyrophosphate-dependent enzyme [Mangrovimonas sp. ST2L15]